MPPSQSNGALKRVLMICYYFPPVITSGAARSVGFARHLQESGWVPTILSVRESRDPWVSKGGPVPADATVVRAIELNLTGLMNFLHAIVARPLRLLGIKLKINYFYDLLCIPDPQIAWFSVPAGIRLARESDMIYATCSPFSSALSGCLISWWTGKPLIVDFRDPWSFNAHNNHTWLHFKIVRILERIVLRCCNRLIVNTPAARQLYQAHYPRHAKKIVSISNGYDVVPPPPHPPKDADGFSIVHAGSFYGTRTPDALLQALAEIGNPHIQFVQIGSECPAMQKYRGSVSMQSLPSMSHEDAIEHMRSASLLYLKQGRARAGSQAVAIAAKTYEYLASGVPILADVPPGGDADLVYAHARNSWVVTTGDKQELKQVIMQAYQSRHDRPPAADPVFLEQFSRARLTRLLASEMNEVLRELDQTNSTAEEEYEYA